MSARRYKAEAPRSTTLSTLAGALFLATSRWWLQAATGDGSNAGVTQSSLDCNVHVRQFSVTANYSWQAVTVRAATRSFTGQCSVYVNVSAGVNGEQSAVGQYHRDPPVLLLKIDQLLVGPAADGACDGTGNSLNVFLQNNRSMNAHYICNASTMYMWASDPIELYMYITNSSSNAPSYVASFIAVAELINVCRVDATELQIDSELYAFAPNWRYEGIPPNDATCSNASHTLTLVARNSSHGLSLTVLAAPQNGSCCSLVLGGNSCVIQCTQSVAPGQRSVLQYACKDCDDGEHSGFTLRAAVNTMMTPAAVAATTSGGVASSFAQLLSSSPRSTAPPPSTTQRPVSESSSLSSTYSITPGTDAVPASAVSCSPALTCSFTSSASFSGDETKRRSSASSSLNIASDETSSDSSSSRVSQVVGATVGAFACLSIAVIAAPIAAQCRGGVGLAETHFGRFAALTHIRWSRPGRARLQMSREPMSCDNFAASLQERRKQGEPAYNKSTYALCDATRVVSPATSTRHSNHHAISQLADIENVATAFSFVALEDPQRIYSRLDASVMNEHEYEAISGRSHDVRGTTTFSRYEEPLTIMTSRAVAKPPEEPYCSLYPTNADTQEHYEVLF